MSPRDKIVDFKKYCETCKYKDLDEVKDPCNDCLDNPANEDSHKPLYWEQADKKDRKGKVKK